MSAEADTTAISTLWTGASSEWTIANSLGALTGSAALIGTSIVVGIIFLMAKRITKRLSRAKGGM